jgi:pyruvate dehydrogenase E1 component alpha subunit
MTMADVKTAAKTRHATRDRSDELLGVEPEMALRLMREMLLYRRFEEKAEEAYAIGKIGGFCHLHIGQEAAAAGSIAALREDDYVISAYREHTQALAKGISPKAIMAELYGRADGCSGGRGGSMHLFDPSKGFMGGNGIVGGQIPTATGFGFAIKYKGGDQVSLCFLGDAAVNQGSFHESLNLAAVWKLPVIYAVENNEYGMGTRFSRVSAKEVKDRGAGYGIPCHVVNGQDVLETYTFFTKLVEDMRGGAGPQYVDVRTYRFKGHSMSDPVSGTYRSKEEVEKRIEQDDPIRILKERLFAVGALDQGGLEAMDQEIRAVVNEAAEFADASPLPDVASLYDHTYATINEHGRLFVDGREEAPRAPDES